jgi:hypothetical protein
VGTLTYGRAVVEAHELESKQKWIGVACRAGLPHVSDFWRVDELVCYVPPMKSGLVQGQPVIVWNIPDSARLTELVLRSNAIADGGLVSWEVVEKLTNTLMFRSYLRVLENERLDPARFHGPLPGQLLDEVIWKRTYAK